MDTDVKDKSHRAMKRRTISHLTHISYNLESVITNFNALNLPIDLILVVISYLDYPELINLSHCNKLLYRLVQTYHNYISSLQLQRIKINLDLFLANRPTINELYHKRILKHRFIHILIQPYIWNRLEMFELLAFMARKKSLNKLLSIRPTRSELIKKGILKPPKFNNIDELDEEFTMHLTKPVLTNEIATKIKLLENFQIEEVLKNFLKRYHSQRYHSIMITRGGSGGADGFLDKLKFFENHRHHHSSDCIDDENHNSSAAGSGVGKKRKRILRANVIGDKVFFN